ncbi:MAG TPA: alpha/beta hydrolase family protein [Anaerolineales bacterium]|nr:alpha/beta hydrolase family protein [Anaerolineales bacterium]
MILTEIKFFSDTLGFHTSMHVLMPKRTLAAMKTKRAPKYRTLYLLHGHSDDHTAWQRWTSIERYAEELNLAVVMPAVHLSFYNDMAHGGKYWQFISEEVPTLVRESFSLSSRREDNFVAGLSMGGYGAFKLALTHPDRFAAAASLSGAVDISEVVRVKKNEPDNKAWIEEMRTVFGDLSKVPGSKHDLFVLAKKVARGPVKPRLYQCCGTEDFLYADNLRFRDAVQKLPLDLTYEEGPGEHNWAYWDKMIQNVLRWMFPQRKIIEGLIGI